MLQDTAVAAPTGQGWLARRARLASGLVLFAFVLTHLLNHALGLVSLAAMESGRHVFLSLWRNPAGHLVLGSAALVHLCLAFWSIYQRRTLRMPLAEAMQLLLGLAIPLLVIEHVLGTAVANALFGFQDTYAFLLHVFWNQRPELGLMQSALLTIAWTHACIGLNFWLGTRAWYARRLVFAYTLALLVPILSVLGFVSGAREATVLLQDPDARQAIFAHARIIKPAQRAELGDLARVLLAAFGTLLAAALAARAVRLAAEQRRAVRVTYPGGRVVSMPLGMSILECSRVAGIAHASVCGGRARCSTCRVQVLAGADTLPAARADESRLLERVKAGRDVRLACQLRPTRDLAVVPLIPPTTEPARALDTPDRMSGEEREICVLFADLRGFTRLSESRLPYDVVFLLNRYFEATGRAIDAAGGITNQFTGDGVMALFGVHDGAAAGARHALEAARAMTRAVAALSADLRHELPEPLRMGIGIHCGHTVVGHMGRGVATYLTAVGDAVNTASRLQDQTKQFGCQLIFSESVAERAGIDAGRYPLERITVRNRATPIAVRIVADVETLPVGLSGAVAA
ncbi:MAG: adenylate/guanylate cyclase domain-containing protein [Burkholderiales bacterium]|nr:adenylate/guanylate cyclase domain-containing protein [Burkholderiales bacterium]